MKKRSEDEVVTLFWGKVEKSDGCWLWRGSCARGGYGIFRYRGRTRAAHRVAWLLERGDIPEQIDGERACIMHTCDNPPCVNPDHLRKGTYSDNMKDMWAKGRGSVPSGSEHYMRQYPEKIRRGFKMPPDSIKQGDEHWSRKRPELVPRGERHWTARHPERVRSGFKRNPAFVLRGEAAGGAKLVAADVLYLRETYAQGKIKMKALALEKGVSVGVVSRILLGESWAHVGGPRKLKHAKVKTSILDDLDF